MLGLWFNYGDDSVRAKEHDNLEILKRFGFTDVYILVKGTQIDVWENPKFYDRDAALFGKARELQIRTHGVFICSEAAARIQVHPEEADLSRRGTRSDSRIGHLSRGYQEWLIESIRKAVKTFSLDGIQLDFLRYGYIGNGWTAEEETFYASCGVDVPAIKQEINSLYTPDDPVASLEPLFSRLKAGEKNITAFTKARRKVISVFLKTISESIRHEFPKVELSVAMMPDGLDPELYAVSELHYGQNYQDFLPLADHLFPMAYRAVYGKGADWVGTIGRNAAALVPGAVMGLECTEPSTAIDICDDLRALSGLRLDGICLFRYGRLVFAVRDRDDTILYNSYAGTVKRLILTKGTTESEMECSLDEASIMRVPGHWDLIRAFGCFRSAKEKVYEGELCVAGNWLTKSYSMGSPFQAGIQIK